MGPIVYANSTTMMTYQTSFVLNATIVVAPAPTEQPATPATLPGLGR